MNIRSGCQCLLPIKIEIIVIQRRWSKIQCLPPIAINEEEICIGFSVTVHCFVQNNHNDISQRSFTGTILYWNIMYFTEYWYQNRYRQAPCIVNISNQYWPITKLISSYPSQDSHLIFKKCHKSSLWNYTVIDLMISP